jgi:hypothetical protein
VSVWELFAWQPPSKTYPNMLLLQKVIELDDDGYKMRFRHIQVCSTGIRAAKNSQTDRQTQDQKSYFFHISNIKSYTKSAILLIANGSLNKLKM